MKQLTSYNRVAGYLNKVFDLLNAEFFESELSRPTITIQSTPKAYGHFSLREDTWVSKLGGTHEINIGAGTLSRPIEEVAATLLHEMVHYYNHVNGIQDCSRGNTYHNRKFRDAAEAHGLIVDHHPKYGWTITSPSDRLLEFILDNDLTDILINRNEFSGFQITGTGTHSGTGATGIEPRKSSSRKCRHTGYGSYYSSRFIILWLFTVSVSVSVSVFVFVSVSVSVFVSALFDSSFSFREFIARLRVL